MGLPLVIRKRLTKRALKRYLIDTIVSSAVWWVFGIVFVLYFVGFSWHVLIGWSIALFTESLTIGGIAGYCTNVLRKRLGYEKGSNNVPDVSY